LAKLGCRRPAALIDMETSERAKRAWEGAVLTHHPAGAARARGFLRVEPAARLAAGTAASLRVRKPDALLASLGEVLESPAIQAACRVLNILPVALRREPGRPHIAGLDLQYDLVAGHAVDLVVAQLNNGETGAPATPRIMLFPGKWVAPRKRAAAEPSGQG